MPPAAAWPGTSSPTERVTDLAALQNGAKLFVNYCLNCHSAAFMRYNRLRDIGLTEEQIKDNLMFTADKVGDTDEGRARRQGRPRTGSAPLPPDLTVVARSRVGDGQGSGADYLYTYLRTFYRDDTKATGWNNLAFPNVGMPHVLWELQGQQRAIFADEKDPHDPAKTRARVQGLRADHARHAEPRPSTTRRWPTWWPSCSGWASPTRASACAWACGCCCSWRCSP